VLAELSGTVDKRPTPLWAFRVLSRRCAACVLIDDLLTCGISNVARLQLVGGKGSEHLQSPTPVRCVALVFERGADTHEECV
jgi:hypothetical protein